MSARGTIARPFPGTRDARECTIDHAHSVAASVAARGGNGDAPAWFASKTRAVNPLCTARTLAWSAMASSSTNEPRSSRREAGDQRTVASKPSSSPGAGSAAR